MQAKYSVGQKVLFANQDSIIKKVELSSSGGFKYYCETGPAGLSMWVLEDSIDIGNASGPPSVFFNRRTPHLMIVDNFYKDPDDVRAFALEQDYVENLANYKGRRTQERYLWPFLKEEFERLIGRPIVDWLNQPCNGCFQITGFNDPLVWHSDLQSYAAAIYLTPDAPLSAGTSFWRDKNHLSRRPPSHPLEYDRFEDDNSRNAAYGEIYSEYNILHPDNWELVDKVGAVYNRLAIWDAQMIHSASSYEGMESEVLDKARLVQLFFFTVR
jgi:hypothetical protein